MTSRSAVAIFACMLAATSLGTAQLTRPSRQPDPYGQPAYSAPNAIPEGTKFLARLDDTLDTKKNIQGKRFQAKLSEDLVAPNGATIPRNKKIKGHVSSYDRGLHGRMLLSFDEIETRHGWVPLIATVTSVPGEHSVNSETGAEGEISRRGVNKTRAAEEAAIGAGVGAITGAAVGGSKGAVIGAAAGAGLGLGAGILTGRDLKLQKGQQLELRLDRAIVVPER